MTSVTATTVHTARRRRVLDVTLSGVPLGRVRVATGRSGVVPSRPDVQRAADALYRLRWGARVTAHGDVWRAVMGAT